LDVVDWIWQENWFKAIKPPERRKALKRRVLERRLLLDQEEEGCAQRLCFTEYPVAKFKHTLTENAKRLIKWSVTEEESMDVDWLQTSLQDAVAKLSRQPVARVCRAHEGLKLSREELRRLQRSGEMLLKKYTWLQCIKHHSGKQTVPRTVRVHAQTQSLCVCVYA